MIKYLLECNNKHEFESWFSESKEYEKLKKQKLIECIFCRSKGINKSIMSPNVISKPNILERKNKNQELDKINKDLIKIKNFVKKNFEFVGNRFSREVRAI